MFQYHKSVSWTDGVFLRPHHFQQVQQGLDTARNSDRMLSLPYAYGLHFIEVDENALEHLCFSVKRLQAILPGGAEVDLPANAATEPLDLAPAVSAGAATLTLYMALPPRHEGEPNMGDAPTRRYEPVPVTCADENSGGQEHPLMFRRLRVRFSCRAEDLPGYEKMPVMRLICHRGSDGRPSLQVDRDFVPPCLTLSAAPELERRLDALSRHMERIATNIITALRSRDMQGGEAAALRLEKMGKAAAIQSTLAVLRQLTALPAVAPVTIYTELCRLMMVLASYRPLETWAQPPLYCHDDCLPPFAEVIDALYRLTSTEATEWCVRVELAYDENRRAWMGKLQKEWLSAVRGVYVGVQSGLAPRRVADYVEEGDSFKLTAASQTNQRVRGVRLLEDRLPSPLLPEARGRLWFRAESLQKDISWQDITEEQECGLAWSAQLLPETTAELYLILSSPLQS